MKTNQSNVQHKNQVHSPLPKKKRVDVQGNSLRRLWLKDGDTTMPITKLTENGCHALINAINSTLIKLGKPALSKSRFLITK